MGHRARPEAQEGMIIGSQPEKQAWGTKEVVIIFGGHVSEVTSTIPRWEGLIARALATDECP